LGQVTNLNHCLKTGVRFKELREHDEGKGTSHEEIKEEFKELLEDLSDLAVATESGDESVIAHQKVMEELKIDGCLLRFGNAYDL